MLMLNYIWYEGYLLYVGIILLTQQVNPSLLWNLSGKTKSLLKNTASIAPFVNVLGYASTEA